MQDVLLKKIIPACLLSVFILSAVRIIRDYVVTNEQCCCCRCCCSSVVFHSLWPGGLQHARLPCSSLSPSVCSNSRPLSLWCPPTTLSCHPLLLQSSIFSNIRSGGPWHGFLHTPHSALECCHIFTLKGTLKHRQHIVYPSIVTAFFFLHKEYFS